MANAREKLNFGGLDTRSTKLGADILQRVLDELNAAYKGQQTNVLETFKQLRFDTQEVQDRWWCEGTSEAPAQLQVRLMEFMSQLVYSPHRTIVIVGHSHFFRSVFRKFLSQGFRQKRPKFACDVSSMKLMNCGVARLEIDPSQGLSGGPVIDVELVLGTELIPEGGLLSCCVSPGATLDYTCSEEVEVQDPEKPEPVWPVASNSNTEPGRPEDAPEVSRSVAAHDEKLIV